MLGAAVARLTNTIARQLSVNAGMIEYISNHPPNDENFDQIRTVVAPTIMPAIAPDLFILDHNNESNTTGPNELPNPAHAKLTSDSILLLLL